MSNYCFISNNKNADEITKWLNAELIFSNWRPVDLEEMVWSEGEIHLKNGKKRELKKIGKKYDYIDLVHETLKDEGQVLVFNNTRKSAMKASDDIGKSIVKVLDNTDLEKLLEISMALRSSGEKTSIREISKCSRERSCVPSRRVNCKT